MGFYCTKCRYRKEKSEIPKKCPYCGSLGTVKGDKSMDELIDDVGKEE